MFLMILIYIIVFLINSDFTKSVFNNFISSLIKIFPIILGVYVFLFLINLFIKPEKINKHLGKDSGLKGWIYSIIAGIIIPAPPYIIFPLLGDLKKQGMKDSLIVSFLYNRNLQVTFLPVMAYYFGIPFTIIVSLYVFIFAIISGIIVERLL